MSRSYYKRRETADEFYDWPEQSSIEGMLHAQDCYPTKEQIRIWKYQFYTQTMSGYNGSIPKSARQSVKKWRKARDKRELWKCLNMHDYEPLFALWNGKDSDPNYYW